jgi:hypothetical protein
MIAPTKSIPADRALLTVAAQILKQLDSPATVDQAWVRLRFWRAQNRQSSAVSFGWFVLACDILYAMGTVEIKDGLLVRGRADAA